MITPHTILEAIDRRKAPPTHPDDGMQPYAIAFLLGMLAGAVLAFLR